MNIPLNADVLCRDGPGGRSVCIILDPARHTVTHFVVRDKKLPYTEHLVPLELIQATEPHQIQLRCRRQELAQLPPFKKAEFIRSGSAMVPRLPPLLEPEADAALSWPTFSPAGEPGLYLDLEQVPPDEMPVRQGGRVQASDGPVGQVEAFLVNPENGAITHLLVRLGRLWWQRTVRVPLAQIERLAEGKVYLKWDKRSVKRQPPA